MPLTPNPQNITGGVPATDFDNLSNEDILKLINAARQTKGGHSISGQAPPPAKRHVDLDALIEANRG